VQDLSGLDEAEWTMWRGFVAMRRSLDRALEQRLQSDAGISAADFDVLASLACAEDLRLRAGALAGALGWEKSRISHQVSRMAARGLVERAECPSDARGTWVVLSESGAEALDAARPGYADVLRRTFFGPLSDAERAAVRSLAERVLALEPVRRRAPVPV
jgi:DNA-binding MarR family transcriptional regulator